MPRSGPRQIHRYSREFKLAATLSKWRKDMRDGTLRSSIGAKSVPSLSAVHRTARTRAKR